MITTSCSLEYRLNPDTNDFQLTVHPASVRISSRDLQRAMGELRTRYNELIAADPQVQFRFSGRYGGIPAVAYTVRLESFGPGDREPTVWLEHHPPTPPPMPRATATITGTSDWVAHLRDAHPILAEAVTGMERWAERTPEAVPLFAIVGYLTLTQRAAHAKAERTAALLALAVQAFDKRYHDPQPDQPPANRGWWGWLLGW